MYYIIYIDANGYKYSVNICGNDAQDAINKLRQHYPFIKVESIYELIPCNNWC